MTTNESNDRPGLSIAGGMRWSCALILGGLAMAAVNTLWFTPLTFILLSTVGFGLVLGGILLFLVHIWRVLTSKGVL